jgi:hypothetical protein
LTGCENATSASNRTRPIDASNAFIEVSSRRAVPVM